MSAETQDSWLSKVRSFGKGGVHPPESKELSQGDTVIPVQPPEKLIFPLSQGVGAPARPAVKKREQVKIGDMIAEPAGFVSAFLHSSVSGKVIRVAQLPVVGQDRQPAIEIANDGADLWSETIHLDREELDLESANKDDLLEAINRAGLVGMGGAGFPSHVKLNPPKEYPIDLLIINGCECEPYLTSDDALMRTRPAQIWGGAAILAKILGVKKILFGIEDNKTQALQAIAASKDKAQNYGFTAEVVPLVTRYPQGAEKQLIFALSGRRVPPGKLPFHVGVVVHNAATTFAAWEAVVKNKPVIERIVTVSGKAIAKPGNYLVRIGTPVSALIEAAGGTKNNLAAIIAGGPMMGVSIRYTTVPVTKVTSGLLFLSDNEILQYQERDCIRCGTCVDACPMHLVPADIACAAEFGKWDAAMQADDCIECGCCQYVCPSRRFLVQWIRLAKRKRRGLAK